MRRSFHRDSGYTPVAQRQEARQPVAPPRAPCTSGRVRQASCPRLPCWGPLDMAEAACRRTSRAECHTPCKTCRRRLLSRRSCCKTPSTPRARPRRPVSSTRSADNQKNKNKKSPVTQCSLRYKRKICAGRNPGRPTDREGVANDAPLSPPHRPRGRCSGLFTDHRAQPTRPPSVCMRCPHGQGGGRRHLYPGRQGSQGCAGGQEAERDPRRRDRDALQGFSLGTCLCERDCAARRLCARG